MPELPEAETIARELHDRLARRIIGRVTLLRADVVHGDPTPLDQALPGRRIRRVYRRAKRVILALEPEATLTFHLGMSGRLTINTPDAPAEPHTHLRIAIIGQRNELRFRDPRRFGGVWLSLGDTAHVGRTLGRLGDEPLGMTPARFRRLLQRRRPIKAMLLDQTLVAGLGNIYCDEALHAARIHPLTPCDHLTPDQTRRLLRAIQSTLRRAIRFRGSTMVDYRNANGAHGSFQRYHRVYHREGKPCRRCNAAITRIRAAGRSSFVCGTCQTCQK